VGTATQPGRVSGGAMDLKFPLGLSTLLFLHEHTLSQLTSCSCAPLSLSLSLSLSLISGLDNYNCYVH
jgi:hypothetical protein